MLPGSLFPIAWREPFGLVMIEAMACGTPVIAMENGSVPEVLENGVTGFIVHTEQEAVDAAGRIGSLDRDRIRAEFDRRFTAHRMAQNYLKLYARLARARSVPTLTSVAEGDEFLPASLVTCRHAPKAVPPETASRLPRSRTTPGWAFSNSYASLPGDFYARLDPIPVADPRLIVFNRALASELGLERGSLDDAALAGIFSGNSVPEGADPVATAYAGHQFGQFVPRLGDGRAILLGEVIDRAGVRRDIQLKGSGRTPYSRGGDGRAALGPVLREYLVSESMHALGIEGTRALAAVTTGESVVRDGPLPGAVVTRVARSHVRVGTFEYFAARGDESAVRRLADYVIERHYPELKSADRPYLELLGAVCRRQAALVASWMHVGFIHGVMNTDNTSVSGETIDYGPCAFMDTYDPATVFSSIDSMGRYAYSNQPHAAQWNLARFAETLLSLIDADPGRAVEAAGPIVERFSGGFRGALALRAARKTRIAD